MVEAFHQLSADSRYYRFWTSHPQVQEQLLERFLNPKPGIHETWAAQDPARPMEPGYGAASYFRNEDSEDSAEISFTIADEAQSKGIGTLLFARLWTRAQGSGIQYFTGTVLFDNFRTLEWVRQLGAKLQLQGSTYTFEMKIDLATLKSNPTCNTLKQRIAEFEESAPAVGPVSREQKV